MSLFSLAIASRLRFSSTFSAAISLFSGSIVLSSLLNPGIRPLAAAAIARLASDINAINPNAAQPGPDRPSVFGCFGFGAAGSNSASIGALSPVAGGKGVSDMARFQTYACFLYLI